MSSFRPELRSISDAAMQLQSDDESERSDGAEMLRDSLANANSRSAELKNLVAALRDFLEKNAN